MQYLAVVQLLILLALANGSPIVAKLIFGNHCAQPLDGNIKFIDGQPLFGASKTIRVLVSYWISRGVDERPVRADRVRKSVGAENTFVTDLFTLGEARDALQPIIEKVWHHCEATGTRGRTVTIPTSTRSRES
jgi:hypothetical protein